MPVPYDLKEETQELIIIEQLPIITERLAILGEEVDTKISEALALDCTEETVKIIKSVRASLNKDSAFWEDKRKQIKSAILSPYEQFESVYKQHVSDKYKNADSQLKNKIDSVEGAVKGQKYDDIKSYFDEYRLSRNIDFVNIDTWHPNITLTVSLTALRKDAKSYIDRICDDLALIETQEHKTEIFVEYRRSLNVSQAITSVAERHKAIEEQAARQAELEEIKRVSEEAARKVHEAVNAQISAIPEPLAPPVSAPVQPEPEQIFTVAFKVTDTKSKLLALKEFLNNGGYKYE